MFNVEANMARQVPLPTQCYSRWKLPKIEGAVMHYISAVNVAPDKKYDMDTIHRLFVELCMPSERGQLIKIDPAPGKVIHASAHILIGRDGTTWQLVPYSHQSWHAGVSMYNSRKNLNAWTIGIEMVGELGVPFEDAQYDAAADVLQDLYLDGRAKFKIERDLITSGLIGHEHVAMPLGRKVDPGDSFDWDKMWYKLGV